MSYKKQLYIYHVMFFDVENWCYAAKTQISEWRYVCPELLEEIEDTIWEDDTILNIVYMWEIND